MSVDAIIRAPGASPVTKMFTRHRTGRGCPRAGAHGSDLGLHSRQNCHTPEPAGTPAVLSILDDGLGFERGEEASCKINLFVAAPGLIGVLAAKGEQRILGGGEPFNSLGQNGPGQFVHAIA